MMRQRLVSFARGLRGRKPRPRILMYHRVADLARDPWGLAVHPERFAEQLDVLVRQWTPLPLDDFVVRLWAGTLPADAVAVTFDDGYVDNLHHARPALAAAGVPATLFLASSMVGSPHGFWWDELAHLVLGREAPMVTHINLAGFVFDLCLGPREPSDHDPAWRAWDTPRTERERAYIAIWERLKALAPEAQAGAMAAMRTALGNTGASEADRAMTEDEVRAITVGGLVKLGGHTARHPALPTLSAAEQRGEIRSGKQAVEKLAAGGISGFAYPYGATCEQSRIAVADCGFDWACTTDPDAPMHKSSDPFALPRFAVADIGGKAFRMALAA